MKEEAAVTWRKGQGTGATSPSWFDRWLSVKGGQVTHIGLSR